METRIVTPADSPDVVRFGSVEISDADVQRLSGAALVDRLVAGGISRLSAERMVEIEQGTAEAGRARAHAQARR
ncbi:MAG TPA: hypothetical protein VG479_06775 [Gaiellaceae bacterium]|jgi:hypothetical protein|nr:hypothetical protein [Gaiellaceae bacterium]